MDILESYDKNKKNHLVDDDNKHLLKEVTAASAVGAFTGRAGDYIDKKFAGAFHPEFGQIKKMLKKQVKGDIIKRMYTDDNTPFPDPRFTDLEWDIEYDELKSIDKSKFKNTSETEMQFIDDMDDWKSNVDYKYDDNSYLNIDKSNFTNTTSETEMKFVDTIDKSKFDEPEIKLKVANITIKDEFGKIVGKTKDNKKFIRPTNGWKYIYDEKK